MQKQMMDQQTKMQADLFALDQQMKKYLHDSQLVFDYAKERMNSEVEEAKIVGNATLQLQTAQDNFDRAAAGQSAASGE